MNKPHPPAGGWHLILCLTVGSGWIGPAFARQASPAADSQPAALNSRKARLHLNQLDPAEVEVPTPTEKPAELSARGRRRLEKAEQLAAEQRFTEASMELERILRTEPDSPEVHLKLAGVFRNSGNTERAASHLQRALELSPDRIAVQYQLGALALADDDTAEAVRHFRVALACSDAANQPEYRALASYRLAEALEAEGYFQAALDAFALYDQTADGLDPSTATVPEAATLLRVTGGNARRAAASLHALLGDYAGAAEALAAAIRESSATAQERRQLAEWYSRAGRHDEAIQQASWLLDTDPSAVDLLLTVHQRAGQPDGAVAILKERTQRSPDDADTVLAYAQALESVGRLSDAASALAVYVENHPDSTRPAWRLFDLQLAAGHSKEALATAARIAAHDPAAAADVRARWLQLPKDELTALLDQAKIPASPDPAASWLLAVAALNAGQPQRAVSLLEPVVKNEDGFAPARMELAAAYSALYRWQDALNALDDLPEQARSARAALLRGIACAALDHNQRAEEQLQSAAQRNPQDPRPLKELARLYERQDDVLRAIRQYRAVLDIDPLDDAARESLFSLYVRTGDREAAAEQLARLEESPSAQHRVARCRGILSNDPRSAGLSGFRKLLLETIKESGPDADTLAYVAATYLNEGRYPEGLEAAQQAAELDPGNIDVTLALEYACRMNLRFDRSAEILAGLLKRHPNRTPWILARADVLTTDRRFDEAVRLLRSQLQRDGLSDEQRDTYRQALLEVLEVAGRHDDRIDRLNRWLPETPDDPELKEALLQAYGDAGRQDEQLTLARQWHQQDPQNNTYRLTYAALLADAGFADRAAQVVLDAMESDPDNDILQLTLIQLLSSAGQYNGALELARNAVLQTDRPMIYQQAMLETYAAAQRYDDGISLLRGLMLDAGAGPAAIDLDTLNQTLATYLLAAEQYGEAERRLTRWIGEASSSTDKVAYLKLLAGGYQAQDQIAKASEVLELAFDLLPLDAGLNNDLGYQWADEGVRLDEAERMTRFAVARSPRQPAYLDSLGWVLYKKGNFEAAADWLERARGFEQEPDPVILQHLGDAQWRLDDREAAVENWKASVEAARARLADDAAQALAPEYRRTLEGSLDRLEAAESGGTPQVAPLPSAAETGEPDEAT